MPISAVDLFCGIGGLTHGFQQAGIDVKVGIDIDPTCKYAYEKNNNAKYIEESVADVPSETIKSFYGENDIKLLAGCAPCQPFSRHIKDKKNRKKHGKWGLLYTFADHIVNILPDIVSMENVPELRNEEVFADFIKSLKENNYFITYKVVNAADYGVPQRRKRLLLLASRLGEIEFIEPTHLKNHITLREAIGELEHIRAGEKSNNDPLHIAPKLSDLNMQRIRHSVPNGSWKSWPEDLIPNCYKKKSGISYGSVYGRLSWDDVSSTLTTQFNRYGTGRYGHPEQDRALSLREGALIQTFPMNYDFIEPGNENSATVIARQIGNAVPVRIAEIIGLSIIEHVNRMENN